MCSSDETMYINTYMYTKRDEKRIIYETKFNVA